MQVFVNTFKMLWSSSVANTAHDQKVVGLNPIYGILNGSDGNDTQVWLIHPAWFFLDASKDCWTDRKIGSKKNNEKIVSN